MRLYVSTAKAAASELAGAVWSVYRIGCIVCGTLLLPLALTIVVLGGVFRPDPPPTTEPAEVRVLRSDAAFWQRQAEESQRRSSLLEAENVTLKVQLNRVMRSAILFPPRDPELRPEDLIPPQNLPTQP